MFTKEYVRKAAEVMAPAQWWRTFGSMPPIIQPIAIRVLEQTVNASAAGRSWSVYGQIKPAPRASLDHATGDKLVYCHEALRMRTKMRKAGHRAPVEAWVRDSSGSGTDEEDLKV